MIGLVFLRLLGDRSLSSSDSCPEPQGCFPAQNSAQLLCSSISSSLSEDPSLPWPCLESSFPALPRLPIQQLHLRNFAQRSYSPNNRRLQPYGELSAMKQSNKMGLVMHLASAAVSCVTAGCFIHMQTKPQGYAEELKCCVWVCRNTRISNGNGFF